MIVIPANAGTQVVRRWAPAYAGVTKLWVGLLLALFALAAPASAQTFPQNNGSPVVDQAGILTPAQVVDLQSKAQALYARTGQGFAIATVKSLEGFEPQDYAYRLGRYWKLGNAKTNEGVLLLVAPNDHKVSIATGYGAGGVMTDAMSGLIIRENILPHFKQSPPDYGGGIEAGTDAIIRQLSLSPDQAQNNAAVAQQKQEQRQHSGGGAIPGIFWFMIIGFVVLSMMRRAGGRRYRGRRGGISPWVVLWGLNALSSSGRSSGWGGGGGSWGGGGFGGGGGGGFGGFGGGSFGGGGASGSW